MNDKQVSKHLKSFLPTSGQFERTGRTTQKARVTVYNETEKARQLRHGQILKCFRADHGAQISWIRREANYPSTGARGSRSQDLI